MTSDGHSPGLRPVMSLGPEPWASRAGLRSFPTVEFLWSSGGAMAVPCPGSLSNQISGPEPGRDNGLTQNPASTCGGITEAIAR
jgi:hypothetical protein